ncbi:hypothetical protein [Bradyrhizobium sp. Ai1a-2]|uniref:hypothetical protein n=1 Tax=Bradyrhizobium sp. Ai1a-2 TaxID=196490 RepID=UPI000421A799|nr:hypothetical protein [Bradyrhizobium sp. Ai1a-2]
MADLLPCPLCRSTNLNRFSHWVSLDDGLKEIKKVQCRDCHCEASIQAWSVPRLQPAPAAWILIEALRAEEGHSVTLVCDNPDFNLGPNNAIEACGDYTGWVDRRFEGETLAAALLSAYLVMTGGAIAPEIADALQRDGIHV